MQGACPALYLTLVELSILDNCLQFINKEYARISSESEAQWVVHMSSSTSLFTIESRKFNDVVHKVKQLYSKTI
jgi:hypothetical protein